MFEYIAYLVAVFLATIFPLKVLYWLAKRIASLHQFFDKKGSAAVEANLRVITGGKLEGKALKKAVKQTYHHFGLYLAEFFRSKKLDKEYFDSHVDVVGTDHIDKALEHGRGAVIVSVHLSNWELGLNYFCSNGYPSYVIVGSHKNKKVNDLFLNPRVEAGARPISTKNALEGGYQALRENGILIVMADRVTTKGGVKKTFFGKTATFPLGPAKFAVGAHAPLIPAHIFRRPDNTFILSFEEPIYTDDMPDTDESVEALMDRYTKRFESYIIKDPTQYSVFYRIWKDEDNPVRSIQDQGTVQA
jgi:KDO2-lipid IV(A) lauroyltransferase